MQTALLKIDTDTMTMSSLDLAEVVSVRHDHFMAKVLKVLGEEVAPNFRGYYIATNGKQNPCYHLPEREACLMAMSYSYELQARVYDEWQRLKTQVPQSKPLTTQEILQIAHDEVLRLSYVVEQKSDNCLQLTVTEIGHRLKLKPNDVNKLLIANGFQTEQRICGGRSYTPTEKGKLYAVPATSAQTRQQSLRWTSDTVSVLQPLILP
ncbi:Rha family transcriptional regulator [Endozoicomonas sp. SESOKO1]|uniref:Rha family transcriptional regulator n=1 Tax=Endozoicomonas sp. SESOKO1 TaxID=2828742 RepID=UPI002148EC7F|nr:Rha family transcriptional regulator [Endozoicomonas sp. SESOKO1]